jgi:putative membrane protein
VTTLVVCVDRGGGLTDEPVVGWEAVRALVTDVGIADPGDSRVNSMLEALKVARDLRDENEPAEVAVVSGGGDAVRADRAVAEGIDRIIERLDPDSAVVVVASSEAERLVPIVESRLRVDAVDRVVVRQSHDIESTYYLLKQFLADEELRSTVLVPLGATLLAFPILLFFVESVTVAVAVGVAALGVFLLYKGLGIDDFLATLPGQVQEAFYSGQVSLVTYVVGLGLALVGAFLGAIAASEVTGAGAFLAAMQFVFAAVPWLATAALAASTGRLVDELLGDEGVRSALLNLPFGVVAVGLVVRGFTAYFLERGGVVGPAVVPRLTLGPVTVEAFALGGLERLAVFVFVSLAVSVGGVVFASYVNGRDLPADLQNP